MIPVEGRLLAIVDVYDALTSERPYHPPRPHGEVVKFLQLRAGSHFDPEVVRVFLAVLDQQSSAGWEPAKP
jgi:putative two-component system response regulator